MKKVGSLIVLLACALSACVAPAMDEANVIAEGAEVIDEVEQPYLMGCATAPLDDSIGINQHSDSPDANYGSSSCPGYYVVGIDQLGDSTNVYVPDTELYGESTCESLHQTEDHFKESCRFVGAFPNVHIDCSSSYIGTMKYHFEYFPPSSEDVITGCLRVADTGYVPPTPPVVDFLNSYRIAAKAYVVQSSVETPVRVGVQVMKIY